jgi:hypothetical protein
MNKLVLILLTTAIAFGATTLHLVRELRAERNSTQRLTARIAELEQATEAASTLPSPSLPEPLPERATENPAATPSPAATPTPQLAAMAAVGAISLSPENQPSGADRIRMMQEHAARERALLRDPDYREAMLTQHRAMVASSYPDLAKELDLSPDEAERLMTLLADQQLRAQENQNVSLVGGPLDPAAVQEMQRAAQAWQHTVDQEIAGLLGDDKHRAWKEYLSTLGVRYQVKELRDNLAGKGAPLRDDQLKPLQRALGETQRRQMEEWSRNPPRAHLTPANGLSTSVASQLAAQEETLQRQTAHQQHVRDSLASILTPEQLQYYEDEQNMQLRLQQAHLRMMRAQAEAEARGEIPPAPAQEILFTQGVAAPAD